MEFGWKRERGILNVQDAAVPIARRTAGSVKKQWTHEQRITRRHRAEMIRLSGTQLLYALSGKTTQAVRAG